VRLLDACTARHPRRRAAPGLHAGLVVPAGRGMSRWQAALAALATLALLRHCGSSRAEAGTRAQGREREVGPATRVGVEMEQMRESAHGGGG
jgi:hypothetical protein